MSISLDTINSFEWRAFEEFCFLIYKARNEYDVALNNFGADGGADIIFKDKFSGEKVAILQCKAHKKQISVNLVREFLGSMQDFQVENGLFLTTSTYSQPAQEFAKSHNITLFTSADIHDVYNDLPELDQKQIANKILSSDYTTPSCARCGEKMNPAVAINGNPYWKCPKCKHTLFTKHTNKNGAYYSQPINPDLHKQKAGFAQQIVKDLVDGFVNSKTLRMLGLKISVLFFLFLTVPIFFPTIPKVLSSMFFNTPIKTPIVKKISPSFTQPTPDIEPEPTVPTESIEEKKYFYMVHFTNGRNEVVDEYSIFENTVSYRKGSIKVTLSKNDINSIQRIRAN